MSRVTCSSAPSRTGTGVARLESARQQAGKLVHEASTWPEARLCQPCEGAVLRRADREGGMAARNDRTGCATPMASGWYRRPFRPAAPDRVIVDPGRPRRGTSRDLPARSSGYDPARADGGPSRRFSARMCRRVWVGGSKGFGWLLCGRRERWPLKRCLVDHLEDHPQSVRLGAARVDCTAEDGHVSQVFSSTIRLG